MLNANEIKNEARWIVVAFLALAIALKIAYYNESITGVIKTAASLFWLFMLPGYAITLYWKDKIGFLERIIFGSIAAMAIEGIMSYYLGLAGLKIQNQTIILTALIIAVSLYFSLKKQHL